MSTPEERRQSDTGEEEASAEDGDGGDEPHDHRPLGDERGKVEVEDEDQRWPGDAGAGGQGQDHG